MKYGFKRVVLLSTWLGFLFSVFFSRAYALDHSHKVFDGVLKKFVVPVGSSTGVRYAALKKQPAELEAYLKELSGVSVAKYETFTKAQQLAFLINAYNAFTLKLIIDNYPLESIKDIGGIFSSPWKKKFFQLLGEKTHLDHVEHGIIRKKFDEPRIHFAVNCASVGCPPLLAEAFVASRLEQQLARVSKAFVNDTTFNKWDPKEKKFVLSSIFKWYGSDFDNKHGNHATFVAKQMGLDESIVAAAKAGKIKVDYSDYDWSLNEPK